MKIATVLGARPQFIKAAPVSREITKRGIHEFLVHTGQHYDENLSDVFFRELGIPEPDANLNVRSGGHGAQTAAMLSGLEEIFLAEKPDSILVYGDTNSTLAGALVAAKLHIPVIHIEAGLRSYNRRMPEEINRVLTDHLSSQLLCPTVTSVDNLGREGISAGVHLSGDVMYDVLMDAISYSENRENLLYGLGVEPERYYLATIHRAENTDDPNRLQAIFSALEALDLPVVLPLHPRTRVRLADLGRTVGGETLNIIDPVGYSDMATLTKNARIVLTDSGGLQKESFWLQTPCVTMREETEWVETVKDGWNFIAGADTERIIDAVRRFQDNPPKDGVRQGGNVAVSTVDLIQDFLSGL